ncbi:hypothetical protein C8R44DRAFT_876503 [Mycena epipterygia]|nr:hypothetical protein C8R44DRAFT_876503 [Mycena epipterygia]
MTHITIQKGQLVTLAIASPHRLESRWGAAITTDWEDTLPGRGGWFIRGLAFLGGPHTCLGWRFSILEMQVLVCELVGKFSFALTEDPVCITLANTLRPTVANGEKSAPLCITRVLQENLFYSLSRFWAASRALDCQDNVQFMY